MNKNYDYKKLTPFKWFVLQNFPFIDEDFDAITNYQLFCKLGEEINKLILSMNQAGEQVEELTDYVNNYFDNLDVQDEVNNKLDEMAEDGTLEELITEYINLKSILCFDSVADMKTATNLVNGSFVETYGYYSKNDGGNAKYKVRTITNQDVIDDATLIALDDESLVAELITNIANVKQFGAKGDGTTDDTSAINKAINYCNSTNKKLYFDKNTYLVTSTLNITNDGFNLECLGTLKIASNITLLKLKGRDLDIKIAKLLSSSRTGIAVYVFGMTTFSKIDINEILDFNIGIDINTSIDSTAGVLYTFFYNTLIIANKCIYLNANNGYINQNYFYLGELAGGIGIETEELTTYNDNYNGNVFLNVGFENLSGAGLNLHDVTKSTFKDFRYYESSTAEKYIILDNCKNCLFQSQSVSAVMQESKIQDNQSSRTFANTFEMPITKYGDVNSKYAKKILSYNNIYEIVENGDLPNVVEFNNTDYTTTGANLNAYCKFLTYSSESDTTIHLDERFNHDNYYTRNFFVRNSYPASGKAFQIFNSAGTMVFNIADWFNSGKITPGQELLLKMDLEVKNDGTVTQRFYKVN